MFFVALLLLNLYVVGRGGGLRNKGKKEKKEKREKEKPSEANGSSVINSYKSNNFWINSLFKS